MDRREAGIFDSTLYIFHNEMPLLLTLFTIRSKNVHICCGGMEIMLNYPTVEALCAHKIFRRKSI